LSGLRAPVDRFFDEVMVMTDDPALQMNRLALLAELRDLFLDIADISQLSMA
jgi:glycyl-tRNA synthetase beta chain